MDVDTLPASGAVDTTAVSMGEAYIKLSGVTLSQPKFSIRTPKGPASVIDPNMIISQFDALKRECEALSNELMRKEEAILQASPKAGEVVNELLRIKQRAKLGPEYIGREVSIDELKEEVRKLAAQPLESVVKTTPPVIGVGPAAAAGKDALDKAQNAPESLAHIVERIQRMDKQIADISQQIGTSAYQSMNSGVSTGAMPVPIHRRLDGIEQRLSGLSSQVQAGVSAAIQQGLKEVHEIAPKYEQLLALADAADIIRTAPPVVDGLLDRLETLGSIHARAANTISTITTIQNAQRTLASRLCATDEALDKMSHRLDEAERELNEFASKVLNM